MSRPAAVVSVAIDRPTRGYAPVLAAVSALLGLFAVGAGRFEDFASGHAVLDLFNDNAFLLVVAVGMTFVVLTGGIDLSVGSVAALSTVVSAGLVERSGWPAVPVVLLVLTMGSALGFGMGCAIHFLGIEPFVVTLAGLFLARGIASVVSTEPIPIDNPLFVVVAQLRIPLPGDRYLSMSVVVAVFVLVIAAYVLSHTRFGRTVRALGGDRPALAMGLLPGWTRIGVYTISGFCSALGGLLLSFSLLAGDNQAAVGLELTAVAAVVIGGTRLAGGSGSLLGTAVGVLVLAVIDSIIGFDGTLDPGWDTVVAGGLVIAFMLLQRRTSAGPVPAIEPLARRGVGP
jgi:ribose/xylose/arabinose/galactoside ABC-type transport system permease subunit